MLPPVIDVLETEAASTQDEKDENYSLIRIMPLIRQKYHDGWRPWHILRQLARATPEEREHYRVSRYGDEADIPRPYVRRLTPRQVRSYRKLFLKTPLMRDIILEITCTENVRVSRRKKIRRWRRRSVMPKITDKLVQLLYSEWSEENQIIRKIIKEKNPKFVPVLIK